jgi:uncharacterized phage protein (TIGR02220 family)
MIVFQQFIILKNEQGIVDMTPEAIARRTNIPLEIIIEGIKELEKPDKQSRSAEQEGRRLILIDPKRGWGWQVVNFEYYRKLGTHQDKLKADRERISAKRAIDKGCRKVSQSVESVANVAHTDTDTDKRKYIKESKEIIEYLNAISGRTFKFIKSNIKIITARLKEGHTVQECKKVIDTKWADPDFDKKYFRPSTLFRPSKFEGYLNENTKPQQVWR